MREILFRAKRLDNGEWAEGFFYAGDISGCFILQNLVTKRRNARTGEITIGDQAQSLEVDPSTVGQYTGLTDKNGKRIFEGDIVEESFEGTSNKQSYIGWFDEPDKEDFYGYKIGVVSFTGTGTHLKTSRGELWINGEPAEYAPARKKRLAAYRSEVIGNIHDNPELLKGGIEDV